MENLTHKSAIPTRNEATKFKQKTFSCSAAPPPWRPAQSLPCDANSARAILHGDVDAVRNVFTARRNRDAADAGAGSQPRAARRALRRYDSERACLQQLDGARVCEQPVSM